MNVAFRSVAAAALEARALSGHEELGAGFVLDVELFAAEPVDLARLVGLPCAIELDSGLGRRSIFGVVTQATAVAASHDRGERRYQVRVESALARLQFRQRCRVFQELSAPDIVAAVLAEWGVEVARELGVDYPVLRYVTQYHESDARFVRRMCEEAGMWWRAEGGDRPLVVLGDAVGLAPESARAQSQQPAASEDPAATATQAAATSAPVEASASAAPIAVAAPAPAAQLALEAPASEPPAGRKGSRRKGSAPTDDGASGG